MSSVQDYIYAILMLPCARAVLRTNKFSSAALKFDELGHLASLAAIKIQLPVGANAPVTALLADTHDSVCSSRLL